MEKIVKAEIEVLQTTVIDSLANMLDCTFETAMLVSRKMQDISDVEISRVQKIYDKRGKRYKRKHRLH